MGSWVSIIVAAVPILLSGLSFLANDGIEYTRMKHCLEIYEKTQDARTRTYLAEAIRAEAWKSKQPLVSRHPTMGGMLYFLIAIFYAIMAGLAFSGGTAITDGLSPGLQIADGGIFTILALTIGVLSAKTLCKRIIPISGTGDFTDMDEITEDALRSASTGKLERKREDLLREIRRDIACKDEIDRERTRREPHW